MLTDGRLPKLAHNQHLRSRARLRTASQPASHQRHAPAKQTVTREGEDQTTHPPMAAFFHLLLSHSFRDLTTQTSG